MQHSSSPDSFHGLQVFIRNQSEILILDQSIQKEGSFNYLLFSVASNVMLCLAKNLVSPEIELQSDPSMCATAIEKYLSWKDQHQDLLNKWQTPFSPGTKTVKKRVIRTGSHLRAVNNSNQQHQRITHCYNCGVHLDSNIGIICPACKWIKCSCGACGCGYSGSYGDY